MQKTRTDWLLVLREKESIKVMHESASDHQETVGLNTDTPTRRKNGLLLNSKMKTTTRGYKMQAVINWSQLF